MKLQAAAFVLGLCLVLGQSTESRGQDSESTEQTEESEFNKQFESALAHRGAGDLSKAIQILEKLDSDSDLPVWFDLAVSYAWNGDYIDAIGLLENRSENLDQKLFLARVLCWNNQPKDALNVIDKIEEDEGSSAATLNHKALAARVMAKYQKARDIYLEVLTSEPDNPEALEGLDGIWEASQIGFSLSTRNTQSADGSNTPFSASVKMEVLSGHTFALGIQTTSIPIAGVEDASVFFRSASASYATKLSSSIISSLSLSRISGADFSTNALFIGSTLLSEIVNVSGGLNIIDLTGDNKTFIGSLGVSKSIGLPGVLSLRIQSPVADDFSSRLVYEALLSSRINRRFQTSLRWSNWNAGDQRKSRLGFSADMWPTRTIGLTSSINKVELADLEYWVGLKARF